MPENSTVKMPSTAALSEVMAAIDQHGLQKVAEQLGPQLSSSFLAVLRQVNLDKIVADSGAIGDISVDQILLGDTSIGGIQLNNMSATIQAGNTYLQGVEMVLELHFYIDWWYDIKIWSDSGTWDLGSMNIPIPVGNVSIPALPNIVANIPQVNIPSMTAKMEPIASLDLGAGSMSNMQVLNTVAPVKGFSVTGMSFGSVTMNQMNIPDTQTSSVSIASFKPVKNIVLPGATISSMSIPQVSIPEASSGSFDVAANASSYSVGVNAGIIGMTLRVNPTAHMHVSAMRLGNLALSANVGSAVIKNVSVPVDVRGVLLKNLTLSNINVNQVKM